MLCFTDLIALCLLKHQFVSTYAYRKGVRSVLYNFKGGSAILLYRRSVPDCACQTGLTDRFYFLTFGHSAAQD